VRRRTLIGNARQASTRYADAARTRLQLGASRDGPYDDAALWAREQAGGKTTVAGIRRAGGTQRAFARMKKIGPREPMRKEYQ